MRDITEQLAEEQQAGKLRGFNINLKFDKGTVILIGHVSNKKQFDLAEATAARVQGVERVDNGLAIADGERTWACHRYAPCIMHLW